LIDKVSNAKAKRYNYYEERRPFENCAEPLKSISDFYLYIQKEIEIKLRNILNISSFNSS